MTDRKNLREVIGLDFTKRVVCEDLMVESMQRHCELYKAANGKWYLELANQEYGEVDDATTYGPFATEEACMNHLDNFSNPGGYGIDDSGTRPAPTESPNGQPLQSPHGRRVGGGGFGGYGIGGRSRW